MSYSGINGFLQHDQVMLHQSDDIHSWPIGNQTFPFLQNFISSDPQFPQAIYANSVSLTPEPTVDEHGQPVKMRKKPGRKPNPASPALRKAQNRAAQRAFRERKERHLKDLETTIRGLREQRNHAVQELGSMKTKLDSFKAENWYLKGVVLTLQFVCLHYNIAIPTHSPYLSEDALADMAHTTPHAIEAYVNAYTRNNIHLKPTMASHFSNTRSEESGKATNSTSSSSYRSAEVNHSHNHSNNHNDEDEDEEDEEDESTGSMDDTDGWRRSRSSVFDEDMAIDDESEPSMASPVKSEPSDERGHDIDQSHSEPQKSSPSSLSAIQRIRLQLRVQSALTDTDKADVRLQPTLLQLAIPHDLRIDLIPTPHMRDRMIIFRDQMDYDRCFGMLLNGAVYHGGDPTLSESWELPPEFFSEFWYLAINYDVSKTNKWRRLKGLAEIKVGPNEEEMRSRETNDNHNWTEDVFRQMAHGMPSLQPLDPNHFRLSPSPESKAPGSEASHPLYEHLMGSPPESRNPARSPSLGAMMDLMGSLNTHFS
ncbi:hypothetical protein CLU79DRAFT_782169 [Phycomyces nitens]|nr:hypothetical protein CLU79DRAFT_782169 [Phycomyces nitens]